MLSNYPPEVDVPIAITEDGNWTNAYFRGLVRGALRRIFFRWPGRKVAMAPYRVEVPQYKANGDLAKKLGVFHKCATCGVLGKEVPGKKNPKGHIRIWLDHKDPVVPLDRYPDWREYMERLFCDPSNFEALCDNCHKDKSTSENTIRRANAKQRREATNPTSSGGTLPSSDPVTGNE